MRLIGKVVWVFLVGVLPIGGCNEVTSPPALDLVIRDAAGLLEGVQVCEGDTEDNCAVSDVNGEVALDVPVSQEIFYTLKKEGYDSLVFAEVIPQTGSAGSGTYRRTKKSRRCTTKWICHTPDAARDRSSSS